MKEIEKFVISENGVLTKYNGNDRDVIIPEGIKKIDGHVFFNDDLLESISLPDSIEDIDVTNFSGCKNLKFNEDGGIKYLGNKNNPYLVLVSAEPSIKEGDIKDGCKLIMEKAFDEHEGLVRVFIPSSVRYIGFMAFYGCNSLRELFLSDGVEKISSCAFYNCGITKIDMPSSIKHIGRDAFGLTDLKEVILSDGITYIGSEAFAHTDILFNEYDGGYYLGSNKNPYLCFMRPKDKSVSNVAIHESCKIIYSNAFIRCKRLRNVTVPDGLLQIGQNAFRECSELESFNLPDSLAVIDECAFADCKNLRDIKIPGTEITVASGAFMSCRSIESIDLVNAVVGDNAFEDCEGLKKLTVGPLSNLYGDYIFAGCVSLREAILPKELKNRFDEDEFNDSKNIKIKYV